MARRNALNASRDAGSSSGAKSGWGEKRPGESTDALQSSSDDRDSAEQPVSSTEQTRAAVIIFPNINGASHAWINVRNGSGADRPPKRGKRNSQPPRYDPGIAKSAHSLRTSSA